MPRLTAGRLGCVFADAFDGLPLNRNISNRQQYILTPKRNADSLIVPCLSHFLPNVAISLPCLSTGRSLAVLPWSQGSHLGVRSVVKQRVCFEPVFVPVPKGRRYVSPGWSDANVASVAQPWSRGCLSVHSPKRGSPNAALGSDQAGSRRSCDFGRDRAVHQASRS